MQAIMADEPAPVFSCWNGIIAFRPDPFLPVHLRHSNRLSTKPLTSPLPTSHPSYGQPATLSPAQTPPMSFRVSNDKECFSSESFLMPYDFRRQFEMNDIYLNPRVINSYDWGFYVWYKYVLRHWMVKWWIESVENGRGMHLAKMIIGDSTKVWRWDGGECQPVSDGCPVRIVQKLMITIVVVMSPPRTRIYFGVVYLERASWIII